MNCQKIALAGRSNVGKSSFISTMLQPQELANIGKPGSDSSELL